MIGRVTQGFMVKDFNNNLTRRQEALQNVQNELASGYKIQYPSQNPVSTINFMDFESRLKEIDTYNQILELTKGKINVVDSALNSLTDIIQRIRELTVQASNNTYTLEDRKLMAIEVDQLLREIINIANSYYKNNSLFGGTSLIDKPFKINKQIDSETGNEFVQDVRYLGNNQSQIVEVDRKELVELFIPGNQVFWADNMGIYPTIPVNGYTAKSDSIINIDGKDIYIKTGDNIEIIADKINNSGVAVRASVQTQNGLSFFVLETTSPHQISLFDKDGSTVLQDLGLIDNGMSPPYNYSPSARVYTGSLFEVLINLRKALLKDNTFEIGGTSLGGIDNVLSNILKYRAHLGAVSERIDKILERLSSDKIYYVDAKQTSIGTDIPDAVMRMKMLEYSHEVALNIGSRILPKTLLDFLR